MSEVSSIFELPASEHWRLCWLRIAVSVFFGVLAVALCVLWVRSYWFVDYVSVYKTPAVASMRGLLFFDAGIWHKARGPLPIRHFGPVTTMSVWNWNGVGVARIEGRFIQFWVVVPLLIALAGLPWIRKRFSLRVLLVGMTLLAYWLGLGVWSARAYLRELDGTKNTVQP